MKPNPQRARLRRDDVTTFEEHGYLIYGHQVFDEDTLARLTDIFEDHLSSKGERLSDELDVPHWRDDRLLEFLLSDDVLNLVEPILGPDVVLFTSHFICKEPYAGRATPWHEDSYLWSRFDLSDYARIVTVWLALDESKEENGCMRVIPGSHSNGGFSESYEATDPTRATFKEGMSDVDERAAVDLRLRRGEASLHDGRIVHGARPNTSRSRRTGYTMRYFPSEVRMRAQADREWKLWLARGEARAGNEYQNV